jgi:para-nitrobenzyl esterase
VQKEITRVNTIKLDTGYISGTVLGEPGREVRVYRGIPYAAPPVGYLRWKPPQPATPWRGIRECTAYSIQPAQLPDVNIPDADKVAMSEDCLYLNVLTPAKKAKEKLPVMVWFHGGALRYGSGNLALCNSLGLPQHGVVLVTVNHRLGVLGLMAHPLLSRESPHGASGNYQFLDLMASLQWIKRNIAAFGGDPDNVTIFGCSGGGMKVIYLMSSPLAKGLFHRAICQSGGGNYTTATLKEMEEFGKDLFARLGVNKERDPLASARALPWQKIIEADQAMSMELGKKLGFWAGFAGPWDLAVDGWVMTDTMLNVFKAGKQNPVPFIMFAIQGEITGPGFVHVPHVIPNYVNLLFGASKANVKGYAGIFDQLPSNWKSEGSVSSHGMECHYVFGAVDDQECWKRESFLFASAGVKSPLPLISDAERRVSETMMKIWTRFAKTGDPNIKGMVTWPAWDKDTDQYLYVADPLQVKTGYSKLA